MDIKELRIGNVIINRLLSTVSGEYLVTSDVFAFLENNPDQDIYYPILLHEEYLGRFGFFKCKETGINGWYQHNYYCNVHNFYGIMQFNVKSRALLLTMECGNPDNLQEIIGEYQGFVGYKIQYVHQLQNLYFAITGEELILNQ